MLKISIITVCYNSAYTIEQTIQSVIYQPYENIEYIIIDGGSTDGTLDIIRKYKDKLTYWVSEPDNGIYDAMNKGIKAATGDVVGIINSDDWYSKNIFSEISTIFQENNVDIIYGDIEAYIEEDKIFQRYCSKVPIDDLRAYMMICHPSVFVRRNIYNRYGMFLGKEYPIIADYELMLRFYTRGCRFYYLPKVIAYFRMNGLSSTRTWRVMIDERNVASNYMKHLPSAKIPSVALRLGKMNLQRRENIRENFFFRRMRRSQEWNPLLQFMREVFFRDKSKIIIFGTGNVGMECYCFLRKRCGDTLEIEGFIDNDEKKTGKNIGQCIIYLPNEILKNDKDVMVIIASDRYYDEMKKQLYKMGYLAGENWIEFSVLKKMCMEYERTIQIAIKEKLNLFKEHL